MKTRKQIAFFGIAAVFAVMGAVALAGCGDGEKPQDWPVESLTIQAGETYNVPVEGKGYTATEWKNAKDATVAKIEADYEKSEAIHRYGVFEEREAKLILEKNPTDFAIYKKDGLGLLYISTDRINDLNFDDALKNFFSGTPEIAKLKNHQRLSVKSA